MRFRTWPVVALALLGLLALIAVSILAARGKADDAYAQLDNLNTRYRNIETRLRRVAIRPSPVGHPGARLPARQHRADRRLPLAADRAEERKRPPDRRARAAAQRRAIPRATTRCVASSTITGKRYDPLFDGTHRRRSLRVPAPRGGPAARRRHGDLSRDRGHQQREPERTARSGRRRGSASCTST